MIVDLHLPSGLVCRNAGGMLKSKFNEWPWEKYDGVLVNDPHRIGEADINRVYQLGARTPRVAYEKLLKNDGSSVSKFAARGGGFRAEPFFQYSQHICLSGLDAGLIPDFRVQRRLFHVLPPNQSHDVELL